MIQTYFLDDSDIFSGQPQLLGILMSDLALIDELIDSDICIINESCAIKKLCVLIRLAIKTLKLTEVSDVYKKHQEQDVLRRVSDSEEKSLSNLRLIWSEMSDTIKSPGIIIVTSWMYLCIHIITYTHLTVQSCIQTTPQCIPNALVTNWH